VTVKLNDRRRGFVAAASSEEMRQSDELAAMEKFGFQAPRQNFKDPSGTGHHVAV
jgi:hypothetical protein